MMNEEKPFSSFHFQSDLTVGDSYKELNPKEYLSDFSGKLKSYLEFNFNSSTYNRVIDKTQINIKKDERNKLLLHLYELNKEINKTK